MQRSRCIKARAHDAAPDLADATVRAEYCEFARCDGGQRGRLIDNWPANTARVARRARCAEYRAAMWPKPHYFYLIRTQQQRAGGAPDRPQPAKVPSPHMPSPHTVGGQRGGLKKASNTTSPLFGPFAADPPCPPTQVPRSQDRSCGGLRRTRRMGGAGSVLRRVRPRLGSS